MTKISLAKGSILTSDVREQIVSQGIPVDPHILFCLSLNGPAELNALTVHTTNVVVGKSIPFAKGSLLIPIDVQLKSERIIYWEMTVNFPNAFYSTFLLTSGEVHLLKRKSKTEAGKTFSGQALVP